MHNENIFIISFTNKKRPSKKVAISKALMHDEYLISLCEISRRAFDHLLIENPYIVDVNRCSPMPEYLGLFRVVDEHNTRATYQIISSSLMSPRITVETELI